MTTCIREQNKRVKQNPNPSLEGPAQMDTGYKAKGSELPFTGSRTRLKILVQATSFLGPGMKTELLTRRKGLTLRRANMNGKHQEGRGRNQV